MNFEAIPNLYILIQTRVSSIVYGVTHLFPKHMLLFLMTSYVHLRKCSAYVAMKMLLPIKKIKNLTKLTHGELNSNILTSIVDLYSSVRRRDNEHVTVIHTLWLTGYYIK